MHYIPESVSSVRDVIHFLGEHDACVLLNV